MTRLFVDQREIPNQIPEAASLDLVVRYVEEKHMRPDSVIREIRVDGLPFGSESFGSDPSALLMALEQKQRIDVTTGTIKEIARDSIQEAIAYLARAEAITPSLAVSFQLSPGPGAFENLKQFYEGFSCLTNLLGRLETSLHVSLDEVSVGGMSARQLYLKLVPILKQLVEAQEKTDFILIADLLEYEILPLVPQWKNLFAGVGEKLDSAC